MNPIRWLVILIVLLVIEIIAASDLQGLASLATSLKEIATDKNVAAGK